MEIKQLCKEEYQGKKFTASYITNGYYNIYPNEKGFRIYYVKFDSPVKKSFDDTFFGDWLEKPIAFGAFENSQLEGYIEGSIESWNNRFRISNICIFNNSKRNVGMGTKLLNIISDVAKSLNARMIVLETQSCNENAIAFYQKNGFRL